MNLNELDRKKRDEEKIEEIMKKVKEKITLKLYLDSIEKWKYIWETRKKTNFVYSECPACVLTDKIVAILDETGICYNNKCLCPIDYNYLNYNITDDENFFLICTHPNSRFSKYNYMIKHNIKDGIINACNDILENTKWFSYKEYISNIEKSITEYIEELAW